MLTAGDADRAASMLRAALALWRGAPLEEFGWAPFAPMEMRRLEELRLAAVELRVEADLAAGPRAELVPELQRLTTDHPSRERLHGQLMVALYRSGRQAEALEAYRHARGVLIEEFGIEPGSELRDIHQAILVHDPALDAERAAGSTRRRRRSALPSLPNRTIGRAEDVRAVAERLRGGRVRLLTLTGPGGVGKTRLALEAAHAVEGELADGAWFVSLAAVQRARDVAGAIISALGIVPLAGESAEETVERFLAAKHLLLVVDNCEHLLAAAPFIGRLPAAGPGVRVLATSREPLTVQAEHVHPVWPLALPEAGTQVDPGALVRAGAIALFCERAAAHDADFELSDENASAVAAICRRLDGLPLAIELAAARCGLLSPGEIAARLHAALRRAGQRRARRARPPADAARHARLEPWPPGRRRAGPASPASPCSPVVPRCRRRRRSPAPAWTPSSGSSRRACSCAAGTSTAARLAMLETVRDYAGERFAGLPDGEAVRERHFGFFLALARCHGTEPALDGPERREHLGCLDAEVANLRAALDWAAERDARGVLELSAGLVDYWMRRDRYRRGRRSGAAGAAEVGCPHGSGAARPRLVEGVLAALGARASRDELRSAALGGRGDRQDADRGR